jgi:hypothetical protein
MLWNGRAAETFEDIFALFGLITQPLAGANGLAVAMTTFDFMKQFSMFATLASASGG